MRKLILFISVFFISEISGQNLEETVSYINTLLKTSTYNIMKGMPSEKEFEDLHDMIKIDSKGRMDVTRYYTDNSKGKHEKAEVFQFFVYLKAIQIGIKKDRPEYKRFALTIACKDAKLCFGGMGIDRRDAEFNITSQTDRDKLYNAFSHLIELANANKDYYAKDPFGN